MGVLKYFFFCYLPNLLNFLLRYALTCGRRRAKATQANWRFEHRTACEATCEKCKLHYTCFWHLTNLSEWIYLPKITLATRYLVSVPTHFPSNMEITHPTCLAFTDALKVETYLLQINLRFCFGWWDQSGNLVGFWSI